MILFVKYQSASDRCAMRLTDVESLECCLCDNAFSTEQAHEETAYSRVNFCLARLFVKYQSTFDRYAVGLTDVESFKSFSQVLRRHLQWVHCGRSKDIYRVFFFHWASP